MQLVFYLVVNYRNGETRTLKRKPKYLKRYEVPIEVHLDLQFPNDEPEKIEATIPLSRARMAKLLMSELVPED